MLCAREDCTQENSILVIQHSRKTISHALHSLKHGYLGIHPQAGNVLGITQITLVTLEDPINFHRPSFLLYIVVASIPQ